MKNIPKILTILFISVFILQIVILFFLLLTPAASQAASSATFKPQVGIGEDFQKGQSYTPNGTTEMIGKYVKAIYKYAIGIVGILAAVVLMIGGVMWIVAGGNATMIGEAKSWIGASLTGLLLALISYTILATINPALVNFQVSGIKTVEKVDLQNNYTSSSYSSVVQDNTIECGQGGGERDGKFVCGTKCSNGGTCQKTQGSAGGATKCPTSVLGSEAGGDWWICSTLGGGGKECCKSNSDCTQTGFVCNTGVPQTQLSLCDNRIPGPTGVCQAGSDSAAGGIQENQNCRGQESQCAVGLHCSTTDYRCRPEDWELPGINVGDPCGAYTQQNYKCTTADSILGIPKCPSGYTHYGLGGRSCDSGLMCCKKD